MTIPELKAKIEMLDDVAKVIEDSFDWNDEQYVDLPEQIEHMRSRLVGDLRRLERQAEKPINQPTRTESTTTRTETPINVRQLHADAETVVGRS